MNYGFTNPKGSRVMTFSDAQFAKFTNNPYRIVNTIRKGMGRKALEEGQGKDGKDVSGVGQQSKYQLIWTGKQFTPVPYDAAYERPGGVRTGGGTKKPKHYLDLRYEMDHYRVVVGKRVKGQEAVFESRPITDYNRKVEAMIEGKINKHASDQLRHGKVHSFTINSKNVNGITDDNIEELTFYAEALGVNLKWIR